ncbi:MAG: hypothetical protein HQK54_15465 [Oligoflexales bacterium]|nr:hypothetical protein [Oligoflexales bacterium]
MSIYEALIGICFSAILIIGCYVLARTGILEFGNLGELSIGNFFLFPVFIAFSIIIFMVVESRRAWAEAQLREKEKKIIELSKSNVEIARKAGMHQVASGVLHNVGNVLNTLSVSVEMTRQHVNEINFEKPSKVLEMVQEEIRTGRDLGEFLTKDERGKNTLIYFEKFFSFMDDVREKSKKEVESIKKCVEHIKHIVAMQQSLATGTKQRENVKPADVIRQSISINEQAFERHEVKLETELSYDGIIVTDQLLVVQILINLLSNAKYAMKNNEPGSKHLDVKLKEVDADHISITVSDTGCGISPENLENIGKFGFTTREGGKGLGLHMSYIHATELGGKLTAHSDGPGKGATFTLELPKGLAR